MTTPISEGPQAVVAVLATCPSGLGALQSHLWFCKAHKLEGQLMKRVNFGWPGPLKF